MAKVDKSITIKFISNAYFICGTFFEALAADSYIRGDDDPLVPCVTGIVCYAWSAATFLYDKYFLED